MAKASGNSLQEWEVAFIKAMLDRGMPNQDILAYFSRPSRSINSARISEIKAGKRHRTVKASPDDALELFLEAWPNLDPETGLHFQGDELFIKAREAMIAAVCTFNSAGLYFRAELFIVTAIIAWTYLLHAYYKREGIDYCYKKAGKVERPPEGAERYWDLKKCIDNGRSPLDKGMKNNLEFLITIRNEIAHQGTGRLDDALSAKLQACCINFNDTIKRLFGEQCALERRLPIALQFVTFDAEQRQGLKGAKLPANIETAMNNFHNRLSEEEQADPKFRYRVAFVPMVSGKAKNVDRAVEFVKADSPEAQEVERILLKESERKKRLPSEIVEEVRKKGFPDFKLHDHTKLWKELDAKNPGKGYGVKVTKTWYWYNKWLEKVLEKLKEGWTAPRKKASK